MPCLPGLPHGGVSPMAKSKRTIKPKPKLDDATRFTVYARAGYRCERCLDATPFLNIHHRCPRQMGGTRNPDIHKPANLIVLCGSGTSGCHGWVESNRDKARSQGYLLFRIDNAEEIPFIDNDLNGWKLDNMGQKTRFDINWEAPHG